MRHLVKLSVVLTSTATDCMDDKAEAAQICWNNSGSLYTVKVSMVFGE